jgi:BASS family bile acid:Na+ symporter
MATIFIVIPILALLMFELGLTLRLSDFKLFLKRPRPIFAGLIGQIVCLPVLAFLLASAFHLSPLFFIGVVLIACCPGGSSSNVFSMLAKGDVALSVSLTACSSLITLVTLPIIMRVVMPATGAEAMEIHLPVGQLIVQNIVLMFVPIALGVWVRKKWKKAATKLNAILSKTALPLLVLLVTVFYIQHKHTILDNIGSLGSCISLLVLLSMGTGVLLSWVGRLTGKERKTIVIEIGMQNAAQSIAIASSPFVFNNDTIAIPAIIYSLMMNIFLIAYVWLCKVKK